MKTAVITGGSDGFGKALALELSKSNQVVILSCNESALKSVSESAGCDWLVCDVTDAQKVDDILRTIAKKHGCVDVAINNAGVFHENTLADTSYDDIQNVITVNTLGALYVAKASLMQMKQQKSGLIINVISQGGINSRPNRAVYTASKRALTAMTKSLQQEVAEYGVRVTGIYPGVMETNFLKKAGIDEMGASIDVKHAVEAVKYDLIM